MEITELLCKAIGRIDGLIGFSEAQEIERDDPPPTSYQVGNQIIVDVQIVGKAMHEHKRGTVAHIIACVDASLFPRNMMLGKLRGMMCHVLFYLLTHLWIHRVFLFGAGWDTEADN
jgi:hypothetical protein